MQLNTYRITQNVNPTTWSFTFSCAEKYLKPPHRRSKSTWRVSRCPTHTTPSLLDWYCTMEVKPYWLMNCMLGFHSIPCIDVNSKVYGGWIFRIVVNAVYHSTGNKSIPYACHRLCEMKRNIGILEWTLESINLAYCRVDIATYW